MQPVTGHGRSQPKSWCHSILKDCVCLLAQWAGSCWYYLRYIDPRNSQALVDEEAERYWMPVDLYVGGAEHAVLHLLYARFWHKVRLQNALNTAVSLDWSCVGSRSARMVLTAGCDRDLALSAVLTVE